MGEPPAPDERVARITRLVEVVRAQYAGDPNVRAVGWGSKRRAGELRDDVAIIFYVHRKLATPNAVEAAGSRPIPPEIEGFPTDVESVRPAPSAAGQRDDKQFDPLLGGPATSNAEGHIYWFNGAGTLGMLVRKASDMTPMALSNWHVWANGGEIGDDIIQPGHPTEGDHVEGIGKVLACGPLLTSVLEWEVPSPLAAGLYGAAGAAAIAAAASDKRDPMRRGQDHTPTDPGEHTLRETVDMAIQYPDLPLPGRPFATDVAWHYERETTDRVHEHDEKERAVNAQFLLGKMVTTDRRTYRPGDRVVLSAAIWDHQPRPCDAYHVVAHVIPHSRPDDALRVLLHPSRCARTFPSAPPEGEREICVSFGKRHLGEHPAKGAFEWLRYVDAGGYPVRVSEWSPGIIGLGVGRGLRLAHQPTTRVRARVVQYTREPVTVEVFDASGATVGSETAPATPGVAHELVLRGDGLVGALVHGGGGEGALVSYCIDGEAPEQLRVALREPVAEALGRELGRTAKDLKALRARRCCFRGVFTLPPTLDSGTCDVHLVVQNVNDVPEGTEPEEAATVIGGHVLSNHAAPNIVGCTVMMLLDHAFDVI